MLTIVLVAVEKDCEPLEIRPPIVVLPFHLESLVDVLDVVDDHTVVNAQLEGENVTKFLAQFRKSFKWNLVAVQMVCGPDHGKGERALGEVFGRVAPAFHPTELLHDVKHEQI